VFAGLEMAPTMIARRELEQHGEDTSRRSRPGAGGCSTTEWREKLATALSRDWSGRSAARDPLSPLSQRSNMCERDALYPRNKMLFNIIDVIFSDITADISNSFVLLFPSNEHYYLIEHPFLYPFAPLHSLQYDLRNKIHI